MKIIKMEEHKDDSRFANFIIETRPGTDIRVKDEFEVEGRPYRVIYSNRLFLKETNEPLFEITGRRLSQEGVYNYFDINFSHVFRIERVSETEIHVIRADQMRTEYTYNSAEECLHDFILLNNLRRENSGAAKRN